MKEPVGIGVVGAGAIGIRGTLMHLSLPDVQDRVRLAAASARPGAGPRRGGRPEMWCGRALHNLRGIVGRSQCGRRDDLLAYWPALRARPGRHSGRQATGPHAGMPESYVFEDMMQLADWIREGKPSVANAEHACHVIDIIEAGYRAAATGETQTLRTSFEPLPIEAL